MDGLGDGFLQASLTVLQGLPLLLVERSCRVVLLRLGLPKPGLWS